jgi:hypothetical protein
MPATVKLVGVSITRVNEQGHMGQTQYDGVVNLRAQSDHLQFDYNYAFSAVNSVESAVTNGGAILRQELDLLSEATKTVP